MSQLCKSVEYTYWCKNLLRLNMQWQRSIPNQAILIHVLQNTYDFVISRCCFNVQRFKTHVQNHYSAYFLKNNFGDDTVSMLSPFAKTVVC